jgi:hypothetical protein
MEPRFSTGEEYLAFLLPAAGYRAQRQMERLGQAFFNIMHLEHPDIANAIRGTKLDPFHYDEINDLVCSEVVRLYNEKLAKIKQIRVMREVLMADINNE